MREEINKDEYGVVTGRIYITDEPGSPCIWIERNINFGQPTTYAPTRFSFPGHANTTTEGWLLIAAMERAMEIGEELDDEELAPKLIEALK